jgi:ribosome-associated translation inhibitor RaiA
MKHHIVYRRIRPTAPLLSLLKRLASRTARHLRAFPEDSAFLHVALEKHTVRPVFRASLSLRIPAATLASVEESNGPESAVRKAFRELERQLKKHKSRLRREDYWKRSRRRELERLLHGEGRRNCHARG